MPNPLAAHPPWRQIVIVAVLLPVVVVAAILAFAFPAARSAPRDVPLGVVGTGPAATRLTDTLSHERPGAFELHLYPDEAGARQAIEHRDVYGALVADDAQVTVLTASAASPTVAQLLDGLVAELPGGARTVDVVPTSPGDPRGTVLGSAVLPLTMCGVLIAAAAALLLGFRPAWRQLLAITTVAATAALGAFLIAQGFLGALPGNGYAVWAALVLILGAIAGSVAGLVALAGSAGLGLGAATMIFVGNAFSGATSAPELLPTGIAHLGQWLPPGAGASLLRDVAYFHGHGAGPHIAVLAAWVALGYGAVLLGHRPAIRFAASPSRGAAAASADTADVSVADAPDEAPRRLAVASSAGGRHELSG